MVLLCEALISAVDLNTVEQTIQLPVIWGALPLMWYHCYREIQITKAISRLASVSPRVWWVPVSPDLWYFVGFIMIYYFLHYWPFVRGIHQSVVDSPHKGPVTQSYLLPSELPGFQSVSSSEVLCSLYDDQSIITDRLGDNTSTLVAFSSKMLKVVMNNK